MTTVRDAGVKVMVVFAGSSTAVAEASTPLETLITVDPGAKPPGRPVDPRLSGALAFAHALAEGAKLAFESWNPDYANTSGT